MCVVVIRVRMRYVGMCAWVCLLSARGGYMYVVLCVCDESQVTKPVCGPVCVCD